MLGAQKKTALLVIVLSYFSAVISFAGTLIIAREIGADAFGIVSLALALGAFLAPAINLGADRVFVAAYLKLEHDADRRRLARNNFRVKLLVVAAVVLLTSLGTVLYTQPDQYLAHITLIMWAALLGLYPMVWFDAIGKTSTQNGLNLLERCAIFIFAVLLMLLPDRWATAGLVGCVLLTIRVLSITQQYVVWRKLTGLRNLPLHTHPASGLREQGISLSVTAAALLSVTVTYFSQLILSQEVVAYEFAAYGLAFLLVNMVTLFQSQLVRILLRSIAHDWQNISSIHRRIVKNSLLSLIASAVLAAAAWLGMWLLPWILSDARYAVIMQYAVYLCAWTLVVGVGQIVTQYAITGGLQRNYFLVNLCGAAVTIGLGFLWVPRGGAVAASQIILVVQLVMNVAVGYALFRHVRHQQKRSSMDTVRAEVGWKR